MQGAEKFTNYFLGGRLMSYFSGFSSFDLVVLCIIVVFLARGLWIGFFRQLAALAALIGGYWLAAHFHEQIAPYVSRFIDDPKLIFLASVIAIFLASVLFFTLLGKLLRFGMEVTLLGWFDRLLGGLVGVVKGVVVCALVYMFLASSMSASNNFFKHSLTAPYLQIGAEQLQTWINDPRLREYFVPKKPAIAPEKEKPVAPSKAPKKSS